MHKTLILAGLGLTLAACQPAPAPEKAAPARATPAAPTAQEAAAIGEAAHKAYVDAINANNIDTFMPIVTEDVVFQGPGGPEVVGKAALREWVGGYLAAYTTRWDKTQRDFIVSGDYAFQRYGYTSTDTNKATGAVTTDTGKGLIVWRREPDGVWRVARDSWSSDKPAA